ncbi:PREDICTED: uncharacterized protein LOC106309050 [Brassica oleracea var. oleracea]|uniref:uncharacterized protein LOC106309050 n=1 Tax=Brassica oleracea var. oleracea TaxID=109376 RepID=UPI0006A6D523|nr:PREDICTED: uncharacterized protein LOC106309050 [Brassica oleracea var. oleracea]
MSIVSSDQKHKTISPYDLTSNDNPGAVISQPQLNGLNYDEWAINFRMALSSRKKFGFLDGSIPRPETGSPHLEDWVANNHLLVGWIKLTIEPKIRSTISTREIAKDLWDIIKKRFSIKSGARLQQLRNSLATCKQNGSTVDDYFGRLTRIWDGIAECMETKQCVCGKCECDLNTAHDKERETLKVHDFLAGLDDSVHGVIRSQLCAITPLPDLDSVYQTIVQNETIHAAVSPDVPDRSTRMLIGAGKREREGLYRFRGFEQMTSFQATVQADSVLWHHRLGHPSSQITGVVSGVSSSSNDFLLKDCDLVSQQIRNFLVMIERQFSKKVKTIRSDNGTEFTCLSRFFREEGVIHETSCVYTPQQNGRVERKHRHIFNVARALRFQANLSIEYWGECVLTAGYLINKTPSTLLGNKTPFEKLYGHAPGYKHLKVFGCLAYAHNLDHKGDKFESRSRRCIFLGYPYGKKGWKLFDLERQRVFTSRDVVFHEKTFPFASNVHSPLLNEQSLLPPVMAQTEGVLDSADVTYDSDSANENTETVEVDVTHDTEQVAPVTETNMPPITDNAENVEVAPADESLGRGRRTKTRNVKLRDFIVDTIPSSSPSSSLVSLSPAPQPSSGTPYPIANYVSCDRFSPTHQQVLMAFSNNIETKKF